MRWRDRIYRRRPRLNERDRPPLPNPEERLPMRGRTWLLRRRLLEPKPDPVARVALVRLARRLLEEDFKFPVVRRVWRFFTAGGGEL